MAAGAGEEHAAVFRCSAVGELTGQLGTSNRGLECTGTLIGPKHVVGLPVHDTFSSRLGAD